MEITGETLGGLDGFGPSLAVRVDLGTRGALRSDQISGSAARQLHWDGGYCIDFGLELCDNDR